MVRSTDGGIHWDDSSVVMEDADEISLTTNKSATDVLAVMRSASAPNRIVSRRSPNFGRSWERVVQVADDGEHVYSLMSLPDNVGYQFLLCKTNQHPFTAYFKLSKDDGHTWRSEHNRAYILTDDGNNLASVFEHPMALLLDTKSLLIVFSCRDSGVDASVDQGALRVVRHCW